MVEKMVLEEKSILQKVDLNLSEGSNLISSPTYNSTQITRYETWRIVFVLSGPLLCLFLMLLTLLTALCYICRRHRLEKEARTMVEELVQASQELRNTGTYYRPNNGRCSLVTWNGSIDNSGSSLTSSSQNNTTTTSLSNTRSSGTTSSSNNTARLSRVNSNGTYGSMRRSTLLRRYSLGRNTVFEPITETDDDTSYSPIRRYGSIPRIRYHSNKMARFGAIRNESVDTNQSRDSKVVVESSIPAVAGVSSIIVPVIKITEE